MNIIFDLDGTLLNTITDLGNACNYALEKNGFPKHHIDEYPQMVGNGINKLIERALPNNIKDNISQYTDKEKTIQELRKDFIHYYDQHNCENTHPYEGIKEMLETLISQGHTLGVASNKYQKASSKIVNHYFPKTFKCIHGEREGVPRKPDPQIIYNIIREMGEDNSIYIGDSIVDIETARKAGTGIISCSWGFVKKEDLIKANPDRLIDTPQEITQIIAQTTYLKEKYFCPK